MLLLLCARIPGSQHVPLTDHYQSYAVAIVSALVPELRFSPHPQAVLLCPSGPKPPLHSVMPGPLALLHSLLPAGATVGELLRPRYQLHGISADAHTVDINATATASTPMPQVPGTVV